MADHPVVDYLAGRAAASSPRDDPSLFGTDIVREYERLHLEAGIPLSTLGLMAALGFEHAFTEDGPRGRETRARLVAMQTDSLSWEPGVPDRTQAVVDTEGA